MTLALGGAEKGVILHMDSILDSIKKLLGVDAEYEHFDTDIIIHINSAFSILNQLGIGPKDGFSIMDNTASWSDFIADNSKLNDVKTYVYLRVKLLFDTSTMSSGAVEAMERQVKELEWRISITPTLFQSSLQYGNE